MSLSLAFGRASRGYQNLLNLLSLLAMPVLLCALFASARGIQSVRNARTPICGCTCCVTHTLHVHVSALLILTCKLTYQYETTHTHNYIHTLAYLFVCVHGMYIYTPVYLWVKHEQSGKTTRAKHNTSLGVDSPFFPTIVLSKHRPFCCGFPEVRKMRIPELRMEMETSDASPLRQDQRLQEVLDETQRILRDLGADALERPAAVRQPETLRPGQEDGGSLGDPGGGVASIW